MGTCRIGEFMVGEKAEASRGFLVAYTLDWANELETCS